MATAAPAYYELEDEGPSARMIVRVKSRTPLLCHSPKGMEREDVKGRRGTTIPTAEVEAERGCYRDMDGDCSFPSMGFRACIVEASKPFKDPTNKRVSVRYAMSCIQIEPEWVKLLDDNDNPITEYVIDSRRAVLNKGPSVIRSRPRFDSWQAEFAINYDTEVILAEPILRALVSAGKRVGIGDFRGTCNGPYGRFEVVWARPDE